METSDIIAADSASVICPSQVKQMRINTLNAYSAQSRVMGHQSNWMKFVVARPANDATPRTLNMSDPRIPPSPTSESITNDEIIFVENSGAIVAIAIKVAAATS